MGKTNMIDDGYNLVEDLEKRIKELEVENAVYAKMLENRDEFKGRLPYNYAEVSETMLDFDDGRKSMKTYWFRWYDSNKHDWDTTEFCAYDISEAKNCSRILRPRIILTSTSTMMYAVTLFTTTRMLLIMRIIWIFPSIISTRSILNSLRNIITRLILKSRLQNR